LTDPSTGQVRVGSSTLLAASFVSALVDRLSLRYPRMTFRLLTGYVETQHRALTERNVDLLIVRRFGPITDDRLNFELLFDDSFVVAAGTQSPYARRRRIELAELVKESWVLPPRGTVIGSVGSGELQTEGETGAAVESAHRATKRRTGFVATITLTAPVGPITR
jgi:DNA-binding transcriptional LysR family regulator